MSVDVCMCVGACEGVQVIGKHKLKKKEGDKLITSL